MKKEQQVEEELSEYSSMNASDLVDKYESSEEERIDEKWGKHKKEYHQEGEESDEEGLEEMQQEEMEKRLEEQAVMLEDLQEEGGLGEQQQEEQQSLQEEDKGLFIDKQMPELVGLLQQYFQNQKEIDKWERVQSTQQDYYLQVKLDALTHYQLDILFYIAAKNNNQDLCDHPVIQTLVNKKQTLETINQLGTHYQKLLLAKHHQINKQHSININNKYSKPVANKYLVNNQLPLQSKKDLNQKVSNANDDHLEHIYEQIYDEQEEQRFNPHQQNHSFDDDMSEEEEEESIEQVPKKQQIGYSQKHKELYEKLKQSKKIKKGEVEKKKEEEKEKYFRQMGLDELEEDETRHVTREMLKNKGLVRNRRKDKRNSRVKHKHKYQKALAKQKSLQNYVRQHKGGYSGETLGIKSHIIKSTKLTSQ